MQLTLLKSFIEDIFSQKEVTYTRKYNLFLDRCGFLEHISAYRLIKPFS